MMYRLIILTGPSTGLRVTIESKPMVIGRDPDCAIRVADEEVARKHAILEHKPDGIYIRDLGSMNRILVNQHEVRETRLKHGDVIELGLTRFLVQALVQADVTDEEHLEKHARKAALASIAGAFLVLIVVAAGVWTMIRKDNQAAAIAPPQIAETTPVVVTAEPIAPVAVETGKQETTGLRESLQPVSDELRLVREDLADLRATMKNLAVQPAPPPPAPAAAPLQTEKGKRAWAPTSTFRMIKIASVEQQKFPASDEFDEMRMLNIGLISEVPPEEIDPSAVHVEVSFFDEGPSNQVSLTRAIAPKEPLTPEGGAWGQEERKIVTATYVVPRGFRKSEAGRAGQYYGYRVRVFYHNKLQDTDARPKALLDSMNGSAGGMTNQLQPNATGTGST